MFMCSNYNPIIQDILNHVFYYYFLNIFVIISLLFMYSYIVYKFFFIFKYLIIQFFREEIVFFRKKGINYVSK